MDASRHLHSVLHPFACLWVGLPWRTFTLSWPLQLGICQPAHHTDAARDRPSPCPGHYSQAFGYYAASVLPPVRWHFRAP